MKIQKFKLRKDGFTGKLYQPDQNLFPGKAFLIVGGGDGRYSITKTVAAYFARAGLMTLAVAYWNKPGLPSEVVNIPLETIEKPVLLLAAEQDDMWDSSTACENILKNLKQKNFSYSVQYEHYPFGSHMLFPVCTVFSKFFAMERKHAKEYKQSCLDSFEKTMEFVKNW